jgi:hypothetical protein
MRGQEATDINGTVFQAQMLKNMVLPWSTNHILNAPEGESFWNVFAVPQAVHWGALWSLTRFLSPVLALNYWILLGWVLSGVSAYFLARYLKISIHGSIAAGLLVEMLPWLREKVITHMAYVFLCIPIFAVLLALKFFDRPSRRSLVYMACYLGGVFFFDLYWFYFVLMTFIFLAFINVRQIINWIKFLHRRLKLLIVGMLATSAICAYGSLTVVQNLTSSERAFGRPLVSTTNSYIDEFNGSISRFIIPWSEHLLVQFGLIQIERVDADMVIYGGALIFLISGTGFLLTLLRNIQIPRKIIDLYLVAGLFVFLTIPSQIQTPIGNVPTPIALVKYLVPGVRRFARSGLIVEALLCIIAVATLEAIVRRGKFRTRTRFMTYILLLFCIVDLSPLSLREARSAYLEYEGVRTVLSKEDSPVLYAFSPILDAGNFLNVRSVRRSYDHGWNRDFEVQAALGDENFAAYLASRGVTHVLIPDQTNNPGSYFAKWGNGSSIDLSFPATLYDQIPTSYNGIPVVLYKLRTGLTNEFCHHCDRYQLNWSGVRQAFFDPVTASISPDQQVSENLSWVLPSENPSLTISTHSDSSSIFQVSLDLVAAFGPNAQPQIVQLVSNIETRNFRVESGLVTKASIRVKANESILLRHFLPCTVPSNLEPANPDTRQLCFGVTGLTVIEASKSD